ncbi:MAG TPA: gamma-glutamylcyclotransferase family protein [Gammaproteobacteria bacterium]|nr:gamma-glutamylcyclotransferase family protein [Gammaproteobacteria bacterium]
MISARLCKSDALLFVYGTLRPCTHSPMALWLRARAVHAGTARTRGRLYDLGAYPGMIAARRDCEWVTGDVYRLRRPRPTLRTLDLYEWGESGRGRPRFVRVRRIVEREGRATPAWVYLFRLPISPGARIPEGDYDRRVEEMDS